MGFTLALLLSAGGVGLAHAHKNTRALSADHLIACIKTAVAAQAGMVREVEVEYEDARWLCEVKLVDDMGKRHTLYVDVADNQVVRAK
jgi:uncharacterized membrane protein YkoI